MNGKEIRPQQTTSMLQKLIPDILVEKDWYVINTTNGFMQPKLRAADETREAQPPIKEGNLV